ncbi:XRE family transcriptional regulator [Deinococcus sp.]|uniref:XRE family transcriptional regulator n=1 Tax=Deinococcus sp. TaxID=47478 RepID=UPI003B5CACA0
MNAADEKIRAAIRAAMAEKQLTQFEVAQRLGVKQPSVAAILSGKRGRVPQSLLDMLTALDLRLTVEAGGERKP